MGLYAQIAEDALRYSQTGLGVGAQTQSLAGTSVGIANDFSALFSNPAGLGRNGPDQRMRRRPRARQRQGKGETHETRGRGRIARVYCAERGPHQSRVEVHRRLRPPSGSALHRQTPKRTWSTAVLEQGLLRHGRARHRQSRRGRLTSPSRAGPHPRGGGRAATRPRIPAPPAERLRASTPPTRENRWRGTSFIEPYAALKSAAQQRKAEALSARLCVSGDEYIYEITLLHRDGRFIHIQLQAETGRLASRARPAREPRRVRETKDVHDAHDQPD